MDSSCNSRAFDTLLGWHSLLLVNIQTIHSRTNWNVTVCCWLGIFFDYDFPDQRTAKEWEINQVMDSDIVVYDLSNIKDSIGTHIEMGIVQAVNRLPGKHIATIGIGKPDTDHPWIKTSMFYQVADIEEAADFICTYLIL